MRTRFVGIHLTALAALGVVSIQAGMYRSEFSKKLSREEFDKKIAELEKVEQDCSRAIKANSSDADAYYRRSAARKATEILLHDTPFYSGPIDDLKKCVEIVPNNADYHAELGDLYTLNRQTAQAIDEYEAAIKIAPSAKVYRALSAAHEERRYCYAAIHDLDEVIKLEPNCAECYYHQGQLYLVDHDTQDANEKFKKAAELDPKNGDYANAASHPVPVYKDPVEQLKTAAIFGAAIILGNAILSNANPSSAGSSDSSGSQTNKQVCYKCGGRGSVSVYERSMSGREMVLVSRPCPVCGGSGYRN